jgi:hypothetical protein
MRDLYTGVHICERYPQLTILWHSNLTSPIRQQALGVLSNCIMIARAIRHDFSVNPYVKELQLEVAWGQTSFHHRMWHARTKEEMQKEGICFMGKSCFTRIEAKYFIIMPFHTLVYDEGLTRKKLWEEMRMDDEGAQGKMALFGRRVAVVKEWFDYGFERVAKAPVLVGYPVASTIDVVLSHHQCACTT